MSPLRLVALATVATVLVGGCSSDPRSAGAGSDGTADAVVEPAPAVHQTSDSQALGPETRAEPGARTPPRAVVVFAGGDGEASPAPPIATVALSELVVGDCVNLPGLGVPGAVEIDRAELRDCDEPHGAEVYALVSVAASEDEAYPGDEELARRSDAACFDAFEPYVGHAYVETDLEIVHLRPPRAAWLRGERSVTCALVGNDLRPLTGSMAGGPQ